MTRHPAWAALTPQIHALTEKYAKALAPVIEQLFADPEICFEETHAAAAQVDWLRKAGFAVTAPAGGLKTAFLAEAGTTRSSKQDKKLPCVGIFSEYDALPGLGHGCGHPLIMGAALTAGAAVREWMLERQIDFRLVVVGSPGEEQKGGKLNLLRHGALDTMSVVLDSHPFFKSGITRVMYAVTRFDVEFFGRAAHASTAPADGINALDAMTLFLSGINAWRQQLKPSGRVHGVITSGGAAANVIPDYTSAFFYVRSDNNDDQEHMERRFREIVRGAALMTGCRAKVTRHNNAYTAGLVNESAAALLEDAMRVNQLEPDAWIPEPLSTDFANVSERIPGVNFFFNILDNAKPQACLHSRDFLAAAQTMFARQQMIRAASVMALFCVEYFESAALRRNIDREFSRPTNLGKVR